MWAGPAGAPSTSNSSPLPLVLRAHPVLTVLPSVKAPPPATVRSVPELDDNVPDFCPVLIVKDRSLRFCATVLGLAWRFSSRT